jgi:hypothetical protein
MGSEIQNDHQLCIENLWKTKFPATLCVGPQRVHPCQVWLNSFHDSSQEDENVKS